MIQFISNASMQFLFSNNDGEVAPLIKNEVSQPTRDSNSFIDRVMFSQIEVSVRLMFTSAVHACVLRSYLF